MVYPEHSQASDSVSTTATTSTADDRDPYDTTSLQGASAHYGSNEKFLVRVLIEILGFTYGINRFELEVALLGSLRYGELRVNATRNGRRSLLTFDDAVLASYLGKISVEVCNWLRYNHNFGSYQERSRRLLEDVIRPAHNLGIDPGYFLDKLMEYQNHRCTPGKEKETLLYKDTSRMFGLSMFRKKWTNAVQHRGLAERLAADGFVVRTLLPDEEVGRLISLAIAKFAKKHCKHDMAMVSPRAYAGAIAISMAETLWNNWRRESQERQAKNSSDSLPTHARSPVRTSSREEGAEKDVARSVSQLAPNGSMSDHNAAQNANSTVLTSSYSARANVHGSQSSNIHGRISHGDLRHVVKERSPTPLAH
tara:strand:+ start:11406 stop:12503 length:1098 start_codon:yes stop_codon:yes gene_type:complete